MKLNRRSALQRLGLATGALSLGSNLAGENYFDEIHSWTMPELHPLQFDSPITAITLGAGNRGNVYGNYATAYPDQLNIVGVAEPIPIRNERYAQKHKIPSEHRFETWEHVFERDKFADAIIITTPDDLHYGPAMHAMAMGYDVLLEKPISPSELECRNILQMAKQTNKIVAVCHVLRYAPYFVKLKEMLDQQMLGDLISVQHFEPIEHVHMAHSFVRGNWHSAKATTPIILAKSCHDLDILRWLIDKPCEQIAAFGGLKWFKQENAPEGATPRCTDGCPAEATCPYSALKIYYRDRQRTYVFDFPEDKSLHDEFILEQLRTTNYGRCVYQMENDQADHYVTSMQFADGITASFSMEAFTSYHGRRSRFMGAMGDIVGDMDHFVHTDFLSGKRTKWELKDAVDGDHLSGHGGGDWRLVRDWLQAVKAQDSSLLTSTIEASIESHIMGFQAELSRLKGEIKKIHL